MRFWILVGAAGTCFVTGSALAQTPASAPRAVTRTIYTRNTELFAEWQPFVAGQPTRLTAHLPHTGDRFCPHTQGAATLTHSVGGVRGGSADATDRSSHTHWRSLSPVYRGHSDADPECGR